MTSVPLTPAAQTGLNPAAVARWPVMAAAHVLGLGLLGAVLAALPEAPSDLDRHQLPKETLAHAATWLAVVLARPLPPVPRGRAMLWAAAALCAWSFVAAAVALNPFVAVRAASLTLTAVAALATAHAVSARGQAGTLLGWVLLAAMIAVGGGLAQAQGIDVVLFASTRRPGGTLGNRNFLGHLSAIILPIAAWMSLQAARRRGRAVGLLTVLLLAMMLVLTRSRAAWLAALAAGGTFTLLLTLAHRRAAVPITRGRLASVALALALGLLGAIVIPNDLAWRSDAPYAETLGDVANYREGSGRGRLVQYERTLTLAARSPVVGVGPGNWPLRYHEVAPASDPSWAFGDDIPLNPWPSGDWVALAAERGVPGVLAALALAVTVLLAAWRGVRLGGEGGLAAAALIAMLMATLVAGLFDAVLLVVVPALTVALATGALLHRVAPAADPDAPPPSARATSVLALLLALATARSAQQTLAYAVAGDGRTVRRLVWAARVDPFSYPIRVALARRGSCRIARDDARAALRLAPAWPAAQEVARRCGVGRDR